MWSEAAVINDFKRAMSFLKVESNSPNSTIQCFIADSTSSLLVGSSWAASFTAPQSMGSRLLIQPVLPIPCPPCSTSTPWATKPLGLNMAAIQDTIHVLTIRRVISLSAVLRVSINSSRRASPSHGLACNASTIGW